MLLGDLGSDSFHFANAFEDSDVISDLQLGVDRLTLDKAGFDLSAAGSLAAADVDLFSLAQAPDAGPALIVDGDRLSWDADGSGAGAAVLLAEVTGASTGLRQTSIGLFSGWSVFARGDFNGDGTTDLMWQANGRDSRGNGPVQIWTMKDGAIMGAINQHQDFGWRVTASGDFNTDGIADVMWRDDSTGVTRTWTMGNGAVQTATEYGQTRGWSVVATGDFNNDGNTDLMWRNDSSGIVDIWTMANGTVMGAGNYGQTRGWSVIATGDFNSDGNTDLMWRNDSSGIVDIWTMANGTVMSGSIYGQTVGWSVAATGDFNSDGNTDVMWRNDHSGVAEIWTMAGGTVLGASRYEQTRNSRVVATGDFDRDGNTDVMWQKPGSTIEAWLLSDGAVRGVIPDLPALATPFQRVTAVGDFFGSGGTDIIWGNGPEGALTEWSFGLHANDFLIV